MGTFVCHRERFRHDRLFFVAHLVGVEQVRAQRCGHRHASARLEGSGEPRGAHFRREVKCPQRQETFFFTQQRHDREEAREKGSKEIALPTGRTTCEEPAHSEPRRLLRGNPRTEMLHPCASRSDLFCYAHRSRTSCSVTRRDRPRHRHHLPHLWCEVRRYTHEFVIT